MRQGLGHRFATVGVSMLVALGSACRGGPSGDSGSAKAAPVIDKAKGEAARKSIDDILNIQRRKLAMLNICNATWRLKPPKGLDSKGMLRWKAFLAEVHSQAKDSTTDSFDELSIDRWPTENCVAKIFDEGFEAAKIGAGDEELARLFKATVQAAMELETERTNRAVAEDKKEREAEQARKEAREKFKL